MITNEFKRLPITPNIFLNVYELAFLHGKLDYLMQHDKENQDITVIRSDMVLVGDCIRSNLGFRNAFYIDRYTMELVLFQIDSKELPGNNQICHDGEKWWIEF